MRQGRDDLPAVWQGAEPPSRDAVAADYAQDRNLAEIRCQDSPKSRVTQAGDGCESILSDCPPVTNAFRPERRLVSGRADR